MCFWWQRCTFSFTDSWYIKLTRWQANAMGAAMFVFYPTAPLCKTQHDWMTASQHPLRFQKCGSAFQNVMNISTLSNALVNIREELWLADSDIPPLRKKCSGQADLPGSLPPCAETLAGEVVDKLHYNYVNCNCGQQCQWVTRGTLTGEVPYYTIL